MGDTLDIAALIAKLPDDTRPIVEIIVTVLQQENAQQRAELAELRRMLFGRKAERVPDARREARKKAQDDKDPAEREADRVDQRRKNRDARDAWPVEERVIEVPVAAQVCPCCGESNLAPLGDGATTTQFEYVPAQVVQIRWIRERYACRCGKGIVTAAAPPQVTDGCEYGPALHAHVAVAKCADGMPLYRQAKQFQRAGSPVSRATLCTLFHRAADQIDGIYQELLKRVASADHVFADETPLPVLAEGSCKRGYVWTFVSDEVVAFTYSPSRSGATPVRILGNTAGTLQVDAYSGYNAVTTPDGRTRAGCWAHVRREFFRALEPAPVEAGVAMDWIARLYDVEHRAAEKDIVGTPTHLAMRRIESKPHVDAFFAWVAEHLEANPPKSPLGKAMRYAQKQEVALRQFLDDARVALDNNTAERALKPVAIGRKNFLFAGKDEGAENLAKLQTIVATCQKHGVNPQAYLQDVLVRINTHPASRIAELLPWAWTATV
jgi:transposase